MTVAFNKIPANLRLPGVFIETDPSKASRSDDPRRILVIGQLLATGTAVAGVPVPVTSVADAKAQFGVGSMLASMIDAVRLADPFGLLWALPLADAGGAVGATGTITVTAAPTAPGVVPLYIAGVSVPVAVAGTETITPTAAAIAAAINANTDLPVTASPAVGVVTLTARNKGTLGDDIDVRYAWLGAAGGEALPTASRRDRRHEWWHFGSYHHRRHGGARRPDLRLHRYALHRRRELERGARCDERHDRPGPT